jgi:hypothetical protein
LLDDEDDDGWFDSVPKEESMRKVSRSAAGGPCTSQNIVFSFHMVACTLLKHFTSQHA